MNYKELLKAHKKFMKEGKSRYWCYDVYMRNKSECWFKEANIPEAEIMKLFWFIHTWDRNFLGDLKKFYEIYKKMHASIKCLESETIEDINLNQEIKDYITDIFDGVTKCGKEGRREWTDASKILHCILPKLFVMWDVSIREKLRKKHRWAKPKVNKVVAKYYACDFLPQMQTEASKIIESYREDNNHCSRKKAINEIRKEGSNYTLAKLLDEYNYVKYTLKKDP